MLRCRSIGIWAIAWLIAAAPSAADEAAPRIYKWVDENGIRHYTTDPAHIPPTLRERIRALGGSRKPAEVPAAVSDQPPLTTRSAGRWAEEDASPGPELEEEEVERGFRGSTLNPEGAQLERQIAALEAEIAREEEAVKARISRPVTAEASEPFDDPEFRAHARRLPELQAELRLLRETRAQLERPAGDDAPPER